MHDLLPEKWHDYNIFRMSWLTRFIYLICIISIAVFFVVQFTQLPDGISLPERLASVILNGLLQLAPESIAILATVWILDRNDARRESQIIESQLVRRAKSHYRSSSLQALEELSFLGRLEAGAFYFDRSYAVDEADDGPGALEGERIHNANWQGANLYRANLRGVDLKETIVETADFSFADLFEAQISDAQFRVMGALRGARMPDGNRYAGGYALEGDLRQADRLGYRTDSFEQMATFYGVSSSDHQHSKLAHAQHYPRTTAGADAGA